MIDTLSSMRNLDRHKAFRLGWWALLALFALGVGLYALRYALPRVPNPSTLPNFVVRRDWLIAHALCSALALLTGPWQFLPLGRSARRPWHRWLGRTYCVLVAAGWIASLPIASHAFTGPVASAGFLTLGVFWIATTAAGYITARQRRFERHREWMIRSYALTAAAISLRVMLPLGLMAGVSIFTVYPVVAWACWIPNLVFAEWLLRRKQGPVAPGAPQSPQRAVIHKRDAHTVKQ